jgi:hypothetical protein
MDLLPVIEDAVSIAFNPEAHSAIDGSKNQVLIQLLKFDF